MENEVRELLVRVRAEEEGAFERLAEQYRSLTESVIHRFAPSFGIAGGAVSETGYDLDDLRQCAAMALYRAAATYRPDDEGQAVSFGLYAKICLNNAMISELRKYRRELKKREVQPKEERVGKRRGCIAEDDPLYRLAAEEGMRETLERFRSRLSRYEREVLEQYIVGKSVTEIAERLGREEKSVGNALYRMKVKIRGLLKN